MTPRDPLTEAAARVVYDALGAQCSDLVDASARLDRVRRRLPIPPERGWRGPAATAFGMLVADLERRIVATGALVDQAQTEARAARWSLADDVR